MSRRLLLTGPTLTALLLTSLLTTAGPVLAAPCDGSTTSLQNGGFETPVVLPNTFTFFPAASVPPWQTTDTLGDIEIWGTGFNGVPAAQGNAFAELNANSAGTLYQDVVTNPGDTLTWTLDHRARVGTDTMEVLIGNAFTVDVNSNAGWDYITPPPGLVDDTTAWGTHTGTYVVPAGQVCTRLAFRAVSTGSGSISVGNFLDAVDFSVTGPTPTPTPTAAPTGGTGGITPPPTSTLPTPTAPRDPPSMVPLIAATLFGLSIGLWLVGRPSRRRRR